MSVVRKILVVGCLSLAVAAGALYLYGGRLKPTYTGELTLSGLQQGVDVYFDAYGIPHIYGQNEEDVYLALGFVHAQERLFQMEMMRRAAAGRLAEILGPDLIETDRFFRTLGLQVSAREAARRHIEGADGPMPRAARAYLAGINQFVAQGPRPLEFVLLGFEAEPFEPVDIYLIGNLLAFGFAEGLTMDPLVAKAHRRLGWTYLKDWAIDWPEGATQIPVYRSNYSAAADELGSTIARLVKSLPVAPWIGSNGWVLAPAKTAAGRVLFANDTHMAYAQPAVWYEAHLESPGFSLYGNHAAGIPFALVGHTRRTAWGLTMFENDDVDFFRERRHPEDPDQVWVDDHWERLQLREEVIAVKGRDAVHHTVRSSRHGPILSDVGAAAVDGGGDPVAVWWTTTRVPATTLQAFYGLARAADLDAARRAVSRIDTPGLNVMYGDADGNVAWWAAGQLVQRPQHVNSKLFLDGADGRDAPVGWYPFERNPAAENPPDGFVYSANNQPEARDGRLYPGYYVPENRARRIVELLTAKDRWTADEVRRMITDGTSPVVREIVAQITAVLTGTPAADRTPLHGAALRVLSRWDGGHGLDAVGPVIYYKLLYYIMQKAMADELGDEDFAAFVSTHLMKRTTAVFIPNDTSVWWDDVRTANRKETRRTIFAAAFDQTIDDLKAQFGTELSEWRWGRVHTLEHGHLLGRKKPLDRVFNVGPFPAAGGNEVINNQGFSLNRDGLYPVAFGPAMRIVLDFADVEHSVSVSPTGQSGNRLSRHYRDQADLFNQGRFRPQLMKRSEIEAQQTGHLRLHPST